MTKPKLLLLSAGRKVPLIQLLRKRFDVYAADQDGNAPGLQVVPANHRTNDPTYPLGIADLCETEGIEIVLPGSNDDTDRLSGGRNVLDKNGVMSIVSPRETIKVCTDKLALAREFKDLCPRTGTSPDDQFPMIAKLRYGAGSRFLVQLRSYFDFVKLKETSHQLVFQPLLLGMEHTVDMFFGLGGKLAQWVVRRRDSIREGQMDRGVVVPPWPDLEKAVFSLAKGLRFFGPVNAQFINWRNELWLIDVNPRFSGGYPLTHAAGADFVELIYQTFKGRKLTPREPEMGCMAMGYTDYTYRREGK